MYTVAVTHEFIARHFLIGGDWGSENFPHAHHYVVEISIEAAGLDQHGYLVDIVEIEAAMKKIVDYYRDALLNEKPEFAGLNPSIEHFRRRVSSTSSFGRTIVAGRPTGSKSQHRP